MSNERVKPLFEDPTASSELRNFVAMARSDGPTPAELDQLTRRLAPVLGVSAGLAIAGQAAAVGSVGSAPAGVLGGAGSATGAALPGALSGAGASGVATTSVAPAALAGAGAAAVKGGLLGQLLASTSAKLVAVGVSVGVAGVGAWQLQGPGTGGPGVPASAPAVVGTVPSVEPLAAVPVARTPEPRLQDVGQEVAQEPAAEPAPVPESVASAAPQSDARRLAARPAGARIAAAPAPVVAPLAIEVAPETQPLPSEPAPAPVVPPPSELSLIRRAQAAHADGAQVLALLAQHEQLYPRGALTQEREMLAIETVLRSGDRAQAEARARRFRASYPGSAHLPRLAALLARAGATK